VELFVNPDEEIIAMQIVGERHPSPDKPYQWIFIRVYLDIFIPEHLVPGEDQEDSEDVNRKMKLLDKGNTCKNENGTHHQGSEDSPEKYFMLIGGRHLEIAEYHYKHENVVDT
jgi:hypothetical protein